jgi:hypothetical protein
MKRWLICITCGYPLSRGSQDWFWHGDESNPEHFACRRKRLDEPMPPVAWHLLKLNKR